MSKKIINAQSSERDVFRLQKTLNILMKTHLKTDGQFGKLTSEALRQYQMKHDICEVDREGKFAICGEQTYARIRPVYENMFWSEDDIVDLAHRVGVTSKMIYAIMQVEASGCGYLDDGRLAILFERHWFYKLLERYTSKELALKTSGEYPQICNPTAGGYEGGVNEWVRYTQAVRINARAAREATSWGLFQVMGFNHGLCGFSNADAMVGSFSISEKEQLKALGNFLLHERNAGLLKAAREENCEEFARLYNGPAYKSHGYDTRLASALRKQG